MRTYTEEEVLKIVYYACGIQKAEDYQEVGNMIVGESMHSHNSICKSVLDYLYDCDNNCHKSITIEDINDHLDE